MKKLTSWVLALSAVVTMASGCTTTGTGDKGMPKKGLRLGLAVETHLKESKEPKDGEDGLGKIYSTYAAVMVDKDGKLTNCTIDAVITEINFNTEGKITSDLTQLPATKRALGDAYNMRSASSIGKEWYEQVDSLAAYLIGKTSEEVKGVSVNNEGVPTDAELSAGITMYTPKYLNLVAQAMDTALYSGSQQGDRLGLGSYTHLDKCKDASGDKAGTIMAYSFYGAVSLDKNGKVTGSFIDSDQGTVNMDAAGKITNDTKADVPTKRELGDAYNMKAASGIGKEWYEQADAFQAYIIGKTAEEIKGIAVNEKDAPTDAELSAGVTVKIGPMQEAFDRAITSAK